MSVAPDLLRPEPPSTRSGRRRLTLDDLYAMLEAGIIQEGERSELIDGELFVVASEGELHVDYVDEFTEHLRAALGPDYKVVQRGVLNRAPDTQLSPDVAVWPAGTRARDMTPANVLLIVEISDTTARGDKREKAPLYAAAGVRELWIMDVRPRRLLVHREAQGGAWPQAIELAPGQPIAPWFAPDRPITVPGL